MPTNTKIIKSGAVPVLHCGGMNMDGDEPVLEEPKMEDELPVQEPALSEENERKGLYEALAGKMPLVQEVVGGYTTFREALDEIIYGLGNPPDDWRLQDESKCMTQFGEYVATLEALTDKNLVGNRGMSDVDTYHGDNSKEIKGLVNKVTAGGMAGSGLSLVAGLLLAWKGHVLAPYLLAAGMVGTSCTGIFRGSVGMRSMRFKREAMRWIEPLYKIADTLDAEVQSLYFKEG